MIVTEKIIRAQVFALKQHAHKEYGDNIPYSIHLIMVVSFIQKYIDLIPIDKQESVIVSAWLHDVMEDNGVSYNEVKKLFGEEVAEIVGCVTNEWGRDRNEKALKTYPKTAGNRLAVFVKLGDRLGNSTYSRMTGNSMFKTYFLEFDYFEKMLFSQGEYEPMWNELKEIYSENYEQK